jgi:hypothetical protein
MSLVNRLAGVSVMFCVIAAAVDRKLSADPVGAIQRWAFRMPPVLDRGLIEVQHLGGDSGERGLAWNDYGQMAVGRAELNTFGRGLWRRVLRL